MCTGLIREIQTTSAVDSMNWHIQILCHQSFVDYVSQNCMWTTCALTLFKTKLIKGNCHLKKKLHVFEVKFNCKRASLNELCELNVCVSEVLLFVVKC